MLYKDGALLDLQGNSVPRGAVRMVRAFQRRSRAEPTAGELAFARLAGPLWKRARVRYTKEVVFYVAPGISFRSDFVFRDHRIIVEIDGGSHRGKEQVDAWRDDLLLRLKGYRTLRFSNEDCLERYCWVRLQVVTALAESPHGFKNLIQRYRDDLLGDWAYMEIVEGQRPREGGG